MSFEDPYKILGVSENDSMENIDKVYKNFVKLLHPDKSNTSNNIGMNKQEQIKYFNLIKYAYKTIKDLRTKTNNLEKNYPDYNPSYNVSTDYTINFNYGLTEEDAKNFNPNKFNDVYDQSIKRDENAGMSNPFSRGYSDFDFGKDYNSSGNVTRIPSYAGDLSVEESKNVQKRNMKNDNKLIEYLPTTSVFGNSDLSYEELGLTNVSDFSMSSGRKGGLDGFDLMSVYGKNHEPWENTFKRDEKMYSKFLDNEDIFSKANKIQSERGNIYNLPIDKNIMKMEKRHNKIMENDDRARREFLYKRDEYYDNLNMGRLGIN